MGYCVYVHICPNNKRYYGITNNIKRRWASNGAEYRRTYFYNNAILTYGWKNIEHIILYENITKEEAKEIEEQLILENKTYDSEYGYNVKVGSKHTYETKKKQAEIRTGKFGIDSNNHKPVICTTTNTIFYSAKDAADYYGIHRNGIGQCCRGERKSAGKLSDGTKLRWKFISITKL